LQRSVEKAAYLLRGRMNEPPRHTRLLHSDRFSLPVQWFETAFILPRAHARQQLFYDAFVQRVRASKCFPCGQRHFAAGDATDSRLRYRYLAPTHDQLPLVVSIPIGLTLDLLLLLWSAELLSIVFEQCLQHLH